MKIINKIDEYNPQNIEGISFDLIIVASGFESRASYLASKFSLRSDFKIAFCFDNYVENDKRQKNDLFYKQAGFQLIQASGNEDSTIMDFLNDFSFNNNIVSVLIDYSCMTRVWYSGILKFFSNYNDNTVDTVNLFFAYSQAKYVAPPSEIVPNKYVKPIDSHFQISTPQKPTALIIGLGNEAERAFGLKEVFDAETFAFYTDNSFNNEYSADVEKSNKELISLTPEENIFRYSINNINYLHLVLHFLCRKLEERFKIIIAPCGPKPFTLVALFNSLLLKETSVWRISAGEKALPVDREANGHVLIGKITYVKESISNFVDNSIDSFLI